MTRNMIHVYLPVKSVHYAIPWDECEAWVQGRGNIWCQPVIFLCGELKLTKTKVTNVIFVFVFGGGGGGRKHVRAKM